MASNHRMFSNSITQSARFLRMPLTTQALYFHLGMQADDDGVVEAFTVLRLSGASEDDLKLLAAKGFVKVLNEDLVTIIIDWRVNNTIKKDRYQPSVYAHLIQSGTKPEPERNHKTRQVKTRQVKTRQVKLSEDAPAPAREDFDSRPQPDPLVAYAGQNLITLNASAVEELISYRENMPDDVIMLAIDETLKHGTRAYAYTHRILEAWVKAGIKSVAEARAYADRRMQNRNAQPSDKRMITRNVSDTDFDETAAMMELMNRGRTNGHTGYGTDTG